MTEPTECHTELYRGRLSVTSMPAAPVGHLEGFCQTQSRELCTLGIVG